MSESGRIVCRFSCGGPSAVATKLVLAEYGPDNVEIVRNNTRSEHPDNERFMADCEVWFGKKVTVLASDDYEDIWDVYRRERFIVSHQGAKCRGAMKMEPFYEFYRPSDTLVFGYTADKKDALRAARLQAGSVELMRFPLIERGLMRSDCLAIIDRAGIELPAMYRLGFKNNNCLGCPKGGMAYWNRIRAHFPENYERMAVIQRDLGDGANFLQRRGERISLDQLQPGDGRDEPEQDFDCSVMCHVAEQDIAA
jgi:3'-phosphoadenosine 5'-phosphosulfate sulfotransferase (PAPS reductase)/FAD synthetase